MKKKINAQLHTQQELSGAVSRPVSFGRSRIRLLPGLRVETQ
jgi:hypothetical protein